MKTTEQNDAVAPVGEWTPRWYGSAPYKGWTVMQGREEIASLGDDPELSNEVHRLCAAHNAALAAPGAAIDAREQEVDRSAAVNLARNMLTSRDCKGITSYGVRVLCEAVMTMDAAIASRQEAPVASAGVVSNLRVHKDSKSGSWVGSYANELPTPAASAQESGRFCNKCGYFGPDELHERPNGSGRCGYLSCVSAPSEALSPATVAQPVGWMSPDGDVMSEERKRFWIKEDGGYRAQAKKFTRPLYAAQPCASQGCGGAELCQAAEEAIQWLNSWFSNHDGNKVADKLRAALSTAPRSLDGATPGGGE